MTAVAFFLRKRKHQEGQKNGRITSKAGIEIPFPQRDLNVNIPDDFIDSVRKSD